MEVDGNGWDRKAESSSAQREARPGQAGHDRVWPLPGQHIFYRPAGTEVLRDAIMCVRKQWLVNMGLLAHISYPNSIFFLSENQDYVA